MNSGDQIRIFGMDKVTITEPAIDNPDRLTGTDKKLIGEFIRRHHPRIGHEIAIKGLYSNRQEYEKIIAGNISSNHIDLVGLIARSHGMNVRDTFPYLQKYYQKAFKIPLGMHAVFLMLVIRISDYFQIDASRINFLPFLLQHFNNDFSYEEHKKHLQVIKLQELHDEPETYYATAEPANVKYFLALTKLFSSIQAELDLSWAIHGEIYGRMRAHIPSIKPRRLQSNLQDQKAFEQTVSYVPEAINFSFDNEVAKLLVGPLYNYDPSCGVRELLQNALDACLERQAISAGRQIEFDARVTVSLTEEKGLCFFRITDNGKGMTLSEIRDYFLRVGASFRNSSAWRVYFVDDDEKTIIHRTGKFGIGILAAFLLGDELEVATKSIFENEGFTFTTRNNENQIELHRTQHLETGTSIQIRVSPEVYRQLCSPKKTGIGVAGWYRFNYPRVTYHIPALSLNGAYQGYDERIWEVFKNANDLQQVAWIFNGKKNFFCNGIIVPESKKSFMPDFLFQRYPTISVLDNNGCIPLSIDRNYLLEYPDYQDRLKDEMFKVLLADLLTLNVFFKMERGLTVFGGDEFHNSAIGEYEPRSTKYQNDEDDSGYQFTPKRKFGLWEGLTDIVYHQSGFTLNCSIFLRYLTAYGFCFLESDSNKRGNSQRYKLGYFPSDTLFCQFAAKESRWDSHLELLQHQRHAALFSSDLMEPDSLKRDKLPLSKMKETLISKDKVYHKGSKYRIDKRLFIENRPYWKSIVFTDIALHDFDGMERYTKLVEKYLGSNLLIPYKMKDRLEKFPLAFNDLKGYLTKRIDKYGPEIVTLLMRA